MLRFSESGTSGSAMAYNVATGICNASTQALEHAGAECPGRSLETHSFRCSQYVRKARVFGRLRDANSGQYRHYGLSAAFGREESALALRQSHEQVFKEMAEAARASEKLRPGTVPGWRCGCARNGCPQLVARRVFGNTGPGIGQAGSTSPVQPGTGDAF